MTIAALPGLGELTLIGEALDVAIERAAERPGWAGTIPAPRRAPLAPGTGGDQPAFV